MAASRIDHHPWGKTSDGKAVELYTLRNAKGVEVGIATYGGTIVSLSVPDREGHFADIVLGFDSLAGYLDPIYLGEAPYFGALIGRYANRIAKGKFSLDGRTYELATNNGPNHLHGGKRGFDKIIWKAREVDTASDPALELTYTSPNGEEGYPGTLAVKILYTLTDDNTLKIDYSATSDRDTVVNLTNHSYFNLKGAGQGDILGHELQLPADWFTPIDPTLIPTGELLSVGGTPFDFKRPIAIGARIDNADEQLKFGHGYDHNFVLPDAGGALQRAARLREPSTGRVLEVWTTEPGVQVYSGNFLKGNLLGKGGRLYPLHGGLALETQHCPDSPNQPGFPTTTLRPGKPYKSQTVWRFEVDQRSL